MRAGYATGGRNGATAIGAAPIGSRAADGWAAGIADLHHADVERGKPPERGTG